jgi:ParB-like nuclease domain.
MHNQVDLIASIDPEEIEPLHEVRIKALFDDLTASMKENRWQGRPLLVIERESDYVAWTGSHRIAAAIEAGLSLVPCYVLDERELLKRGFHPVIGHVTDYERLEILRNIGDEAAIHLMWQEGRC